MDSLGDLLDADTQSVRPRQAVQQRLPPGQKLSAAQNTALLHVTRTLHAGSSSARAIPKHTKRREDVPLPHRRVEHSMWAALTQAGLTSRGAHTHQRDMATFLQAPTRAALVDRARDVGASPLAEPRNPRTSSKRQREAGEEGAEERKQPPAGDIPRRNRPGCRNACTHKAARTPLANAGTWKTLWAEWDSARKQKGGKRTATPQDLWQFCGHTDEVVRVVGKCCSRLRERCDTQLTLEWAATHIPS